MSAEQTIYTRLSGHAGLTALVGTRISPMHALQLGEYPCVTYLRAGGAPDYTHDGPELLEGGLWQFDAWAESYAQVCTVASALVDALSADAAGAFYAIIQDHAQDFAPDERIYRVMLNVIVWCRES